VVERGWGDRGRVKIGEIEGGLKNNLMRESHGGWLVWGDKIQRLAGVENGKETETEL
jgi:hypothetical protein